MKKNKVIVIGDSITKGIIFEDNKLSSTQPAIDIIGNALNLEIENFSSFGQTIKRVNQKGIVDRIIMQKDKSKTNYAVLCIGGNDSDYDWKQVDKMPQQSHSPKTNLDEFEQIYNQTVTKLKKHGFKVVVCSICPIKAEWYFENVISKIANPQNVLTFLHNDLSNLTRHQELFNNEIIKIATKQNLPFLDIRKIFLQDNACFEYFCKDGCHLTKQGQNLIAAKVITKYYKDLSQCCLKLAKYKHFNL